MKHDNNLRKRKSKEALYGHLYDLVSMSDYCIYCGDPASNRDHTPPISRVEYYIRNGQPIEGVKFRIYPACKMCNAHLSAYMSFSIVDRRQYLIDAYRRKLAKMVNWQISEILELGETLKSSAVAYMDKKNTLAHKLHGLFKRLQ